MFDFLSQKFSSFFSHIGNAKTLTEKNIHDALEQVKDALLEADVPFNVVQKFTQSVKDEVIGKKITASLKPAEQLMKIVHEKVVTFLGGENTAFSFSSPSVFMVMGLQGSGKTTTIGKLAHNILKDAEKKNKTKKILVASVDFYRPAAVDQLEILAQKANVSFYRAQKNNPIEATQEIINYYQQNKFDILLLDTAGRLHVDDQMLQELQSIDAILKPIHKFLVLDAMTGQESLNVAKTFDHAVGFDSAILTKMDSDTRGGAAFAFRYTLKKPIAFVGVGEKEEDLEHFYPDRAAERMLGMGDIRSLVERVDEKIAKEEQKKSEKAFASGRFTLQDFADQMSMMSRLGSLSQLIKYIPGMGGQISPEMIQQGEVEIKKFKAIISSMTPKERIDARILNNSRHKRIARGAGVAVSDVTMLIKRFEEAKQYVKLLNKFKSF